MNTHKISSAAAALGLAGLALLGTATGASAAPADCAYGQTCTVAISDSTPQRGQRVTVTAGPGSFTPGATVTVTYFNQTATTTAAADGSASFTFTVPDGARPGRKSVVFRSGGVTVRVPFTVVPGTAVASPGTVVRGSGTPATGASSTGGLPHTGSDVVGLSVAGLVLVGGGAGVVAVSRRRKGVTTA